MPAVSFSDAAVVVGHSSRSTLYRLRDEGRLADYLRPGGRGGAQLLELTPPGLPTLRQHLERSLRPQISATGNRKGDRPSSARLDRRWGVVAGELSEALEAASGLSLTAEEAATIAAALSRAVVGAFGWAGSAQLRELLANAEARLPAPAGEPLDADPAASDGDPLEFFRDWGRVELEPEPLQGEAFWHEVAAWVSAFEGRGPAADPRADGSDPPPAYSWADVAGLSRQIPDAIEAVGAGARFDLARWDAATVREFLLPDAADGCAPSAEHLRQLLAAGRVPADLQSKAAAAIAAGAALAEAQGKAAA
ncbi:hypothetical protein [Vulcanococcus limneticus]|uniref:hypothetical protein n=1 Tax=Vulcanococcus limneticus TaxID=2170428 RepID=UPI00398C10B0